MAIGPELALRIGINLGPLRIVKDVNGQPNMLGDGINVAQRVMSFAEPNQILVSRSYYEIVSRLSQEYTRLFQYVGVHRDKHVREHEVYVMTAGGEGATAPAPDQAAAAAAGGPPGRVESTEFVPVAGGGHFEPAVLARVEGALVGGHGAAGARPRAEGRQDGARRPGALPAARRGPARVAARRSSGAASVTSAGPPRPPPRRRRAAAAAARVGRRARGGRCRPRCWPRPTDRLAIHIGPVAKLLVKRAAKQASSTKDLYERLAAHIDDPQARRRFAAAIEELAEP